MKIDIDTERLNSTLRKQVKGLRSSMREVAEQNTIPDRFAVAPVANGPYMLITDTLTSKQVQVPIFAYSEVRKALNELFR
jgi:hypothetical protein